MRRRLVYLTVTVLICLWTTSRRSLCSEYWDVTPDYSYGTPYDFTDYEIEAILDEHNNIRASVEATNMLRLVSNAWYGSYRAGACFRLMGGIPNSKQAWSL